MVLGWYDQHDILRCHLIELSRGDILLKCKEVLDGNPAGFIQNLTPAILARGL